MWQALFQASRHMREQKRCGALPSLLELTVQQRETENELNISRVKMERFVNIFSIK